MRAAAFRLFFDSCGRASRLKTPGITLLDSAREFVQANCACLRLWPQTSSNMRDGSSIASLMRFRKVTASRPSTTRWS
jgi:hypothetical protein